MKWLGRYSLAHGAGGRRSACRSSPYCLFERWFLVPLPKGPLEDLAWVCEFGSCKHDRRHRQSVSRLRRRAAALQHRADGARHRARRHHRRAAGPRRRQRHRHPAAADLQHVADLGDHHAVLHLLGRAVRRRHHVGAVQHTGRTVVGGDHVRRLSDGAEGQGRRGADRGLHLVLRRRAVRRHHDHAAGAAGRELRAASSARRKSSRSISSPSAASSA